MKVNSVTCIEALQIEYPKKKTTKAEHGRQYIKSAMICIRKMRKKKEKQDPGARIVQDI